MSADAASPAERFQRLFVALALDEPLGTRAATAVRSALGLGEREQAPRHLRLVGGADLHLTLFFLGDVDPERRAGLEAALARELEGLEAPRLRLQGAGAFPDERRPRVLWLGLRELGGDRLTILAERTRACCAAQGFQPDARPFAAHVTVGRVGGAGRRGGRPRGGAPPVPGTFFALDLDEEWKPAAVALVRTVPAGQRSGRAYEVLREFALAAPASSAENRHPGLRPPPAAG